jgi:Cu/Ag efflux protein CusF
MRALFLLALLVATLSRASAACACCDAPAPSAVPTTEAQPASPEPATSDLKLKLPASTARSGGDTGAPAGHPLKGVIVEILTAKSALLVKHDEIPGVMSAMTMLLKVDAPTLAAAKKGQSITATLIKKTDGWWLETVTPLATP